MVELRRLINPGSICPAPAVAPSSTYLDRDPDRDGMGLSQWAWLFDGGAVAAVESDLQ